MVPDVTSPKFQSQVVSVDPAGVVELSWKADGLLMHDPVAVNEATGDALMVMGFEIVPEQPLAFTISRVTDFCPLVIYECWGF